MSDVHECVFPEEQEPGGRLILAPCLTCGLTALDALAQLKAERDDHDLLVQRMVASELEGKPVEPGMTVTEWVLVTALAGWTGDGAAVSQVVIVPSDAPAHRLWGLVRDADCRFEADCLAQYGNNSD